MKHLVYRRTDKPDRYGDTLDIDGIDTSKFERNPVLLQQHDYSKAPIGKVLATVKDEEGFFVTEAEIFDKQVEEGLLNGSLKLTLGFRPLETTRIATGLHYAVAEVVDISVTPADKAVQGGEGA